MNLKLIETVLFELLCHVEAAGCTIPGRAKYAKVTTGMMHTQQSVASSVAVVKRVVRIVQYIYRMMATSNSMVMVRR